jgi:hypothetical protein
MSACDPLYAILRIARARSRLHRTYTFQSEPSPCLSVYWSFITTPLKEKNEGKEKREKRKEKREKR